MLYMLCSVQQCCVVRGQERGHWSHTSSILPSAMTLSTLINLTDSQFPPLENVDNDVIHFSGLLSL